MWIVTYQGGDVAGLFTASRLTIIFGWMRRLIIVHALIVPSPVYVPTGERPPRAEL